jgi:hypothetical protein
MMASNINGENQTVHTQNLSGTRRFLRVRVQRLISEQHEEKLRRLFDSALRLDAFATRKVNTDDNIREAVASTNP